MNYDIIFLEMTFLILSLESGIVTHLYRCKIFSNDHKFDILSVRSNQSVHFFESDSAYHFCAVRLVYRLRFMLHQTCAI